ncbi:HTH domain-containing protein [Actinomadura sp. KC06]|uniref:HTH domain-containing protein n=1 Tax=Actinomadura sp. KC06 TaxID=2530369 RepID=UPI001043E0DA|nr:HTH domain-containing protein [Actinomadura sp. KC06]TDD28677.1 HTH domain-containing protein [Actinomadura sp. KC06]
MRETTGAPRTKETSDASPPVAGPFDQTLRYLRSHAEQAALALREMESQLTSLAWAECTHAAAGSGGFEPLEGTDKIDRRIAEAVGRCRDELLTALPGGPRDGGTLRAALERDRHALRRGASIRTLYRHSARRDAATVAYVDEISAAGADVRTHDEVFDRLIIVDRRICFLPGPPGGGTAVAVTVPAVVRYLADVFDRVWQRSDPFATGAAIPAESRIVRMLIAGETGTVIAKRLGVSDRTLAKRIARLKSDYGVLTHFQLGYELGRRA